MGRLVSGTEGDFCTLGRSVTRWIGGKRGKRWIPGVGVRARRIYRSIGESDNGVQTASAFGSDCCCCCYCVLGFSLSCHRSQYIPLVYVYYTLLNTVEREMDGSKQIDVLHTLLYAVMSYHGQGVTSRDQLRSTESSRGSDTRIPSYKLLLGFTLC